MTFNYKQGTGLLNTKNIFEITSSLHIDFAIDWYVTLPLIDTLK